MDQIDYEITSYQKKKKKKKKQGEPGFQLCLSKSTYVNHLYNYPIK